MNRNVVSMVDVDALDRDHRPIPTLAEFDQALCARRDEQIEAQTPNWVRQCRAKNHRVVLVTGPPKKCAFLCTSCGKDRK